MSTKYLFFDWDGTLMGKSNVLNKENVAMIQKVRQKGHKVLLCSGRSPAYLERAIKDTLEVDGYVGCAGGSVVIDGQMIYENQIEPQLLHRVQQEMLSHEVFYNMETAHYVFANEQGDRLMLEAVRKLWGDQEAVDYQKITEAMYHGLMRPIEDWQPEDKVQKMTFTTVNPAGYEAVRPLLETHFFINYFVQAPDMVSGEVIPKNCTKQDGIRKVLEYYNASWQDTIGFGDSMNDLQMMEAVATRCVREDAPEALLVLADHTFEDPDQEGIAKVLQKIPELEL